MTDKTEILNGLYEDREMLKTLRKLVMLGIVPEFTVQQCDKGLAGLNKLISFHEHPQCPGEFSQYTEKVSDNGEMVIMCPWVMKILEQKSWIKPDKHDRERRIGMGREKILEMLEMAQKTALLLCNGFDVEPDKIVVVWSAIKNVREFLESEKGE